MKGKRQIRYNTPHAVEMRNVKENIEMGDEKSNAKGVSPHLIHAHLRAESAAVLLDSNPTLFGANQTLTDSDSTLLDPRARARQKCRDPLLDCWLEGVVDYMPS